MNRRKAKDLEFISQINRDGSGTVPISEKYVKLMQHEKFGDNFIVHCLSLTENTYIAHGFNSFVVKIK